MSEEKNVVKTIRCPKCGYEYTPDEIFLPSELMGQSHRRTKDALGKVLYVDYLEDDDKPKFTEHFECENCGTAFVVEATVNYKSKLEDEALDFKNDSVSLLG